MPATQNNILGAYFGDQVDLLDNLHVHFGGRFDLFDQHHHESSGRFHRPPGSQNNKSDTAFSPSVGIAYQPVKPVTLFANYTESFAPQSAGSRSIKRQPVQPRTRQVL
jgi:iron complex outermembrane receptor protein